MLVEHGNPRKSRIVDVKGEVQLRGAVTEQVRGNGPALHHRLNLFRADATRRLTTDFKPDGMKHRGRNATRPGQRKAGIGSVKGIIQKAGCLAVALFNEADRQEFCVLFNADRVTVHLKPQEFRSFGDRLLGIGDQEFIDIGNNICGAAIGHEHKADEPPCTIEIMEGAGVKLVR